MSLKIKVSYENRQVVAPVRIGLTWSVYAFDYEERKLTVIVPDERGRDPHTMREIHTGIPNRLLTALFQSMHFTLQDRMESAENWTTDFVRPHCPPKL